MQYNSEELNEILGIFKSESEDIIQELNDNFLMLEKNPDDKAPLKKLFQLAHSLKGASRMLGFNSIQDIAHKLEDILSFWKKDDIEINPDFFQEIYGLCDFLSVLTEKSVSQKSNYQDDKVTHFINKLDDFLTQNHMIPVANPVPVNIPSSYISEKQMDISAWILELMFITENDDEENLEDVVSAISDNISKLDEIFAKTEYSLIKTYLKELSSNLSVDNFDISLFRSKLFELRGEIYTLYKSLNLSTGISNKNVPAEKQKEEVSIQVSVSDENEIIKKIDYVLSNLSKIKTEKDILADVLETLIEINKNPKDKRFEIILSKTINILNLFKEKDSVVDNECYMVILQCIYLAKRIALNEKEENLNNLNFLIQRLNVVEDMFSLTSVAPQLYSSSDLNEKNSFMASGGYDALNRNLKSFDFDEIKVLRVDTSKVDNLIAQTGELLINGIKTREHLVELAKINSKLVNWSSVSKKIINYLKYLEKRGFFNAEPDESAQAFYRKAQSFFIDNAEMINELNNDFNNLYNLISEDDNKFHQTALEIESIAKGIRVLPLATIFHSFPRMIRDIAKEKNKKIDLIISGSDTTVDKKIIEEIKMPLIHILRNSVSHGIETSDIRKQNKKPEIGKIKLTAKQAENFVIITIQDDGYGINLEKVKNTAIKNGLISQEEAASMNSEQLMKLLFVPGFSTEESVSDISGRGIGLDVVKTKIANLNGELSIDSELNKGCIVTIKLPISMSTIKTFILKVNEQKYAIPVSAIKYVKQISRNEIYRKNGQDCIVFEDHSVPVFSLSEVFGESFINISQKDLYTVIIIENGDLQVAFITDNLLGDQEVFHKKLVLPIIKIKNISGFTTLSTGEICLIINPYELIRNSLLHNTASLFDIKPLLLPFEQLNSKDKKIIVLDDESDFISDLKENVQNSFENVTVFENVNSVYDHVIKNETDILICKINTFEDDVVRLIKYLKTDENSNSIKLVIFSEIAEYELIRVEKDITYSIYKRLNEYVPEDFIKELVNL